MNVIIKKQQSDRDKRNITLDGHEKFGVTITTEMTPLIRKDFMDYVDGETEKQVMKLSDEEAKSLMLMLQKYLY